MKYYLPIILFSVVLLSSCYQHHACATYSKATLKQNQELKTEKINVDQSL